MNNLMHIRMCLMTLMAGFLASARFSAGAYAADTGILQIYCPFVECSVFVDDRYYGSESSRNEIAIGPHTVTVHVASKNLKIVKKVLIENGKTSTVDFRAESNAAPLVAAPREEIPRPIHGFRYSLLGDYSTYSYEEPPVVRISGNLAGLSGFMELKINEQMAFRTEGRIAQGLMTYDGQLMDGTPSKESGVPDSMWELRLLGRYYFASYASHILCLFGGLGYRYLNDDSGKVSPSGYQRESNYCYYAIGGEYEGFFGNEWSWIAIGEYDSLLLGTQKSYLSDVAPSLSDATNNQSLGFGFRASLGLNKESGSYIMGLRLFFNYWLIDRSDYDTLYQNGIPIDYVYEPQNNTQETGLSLYIAF